MAAVTGLTAERMQEIIDSTVTGADVVGDDLILTLFDASTINAGNVRGSVGPTGGAGTILCTSTTRPDLEEDEAGKSIYETDTGLEFLWTGTSFISPLSGMFPVGFEMVWPGTFASIPPSFRHEAGQILLRADYPDLFGVLGTEWNTGGETGAQFRLPDSKDRVVVGAGGTYGVGDIGGSNTHTLVAGEMPNHTHTEGVHTHTMAHVLVGAGIDVDVFTPGAGSPSNTGFGNGAGTGHAGSGNPHNNMQKYAAKYVIIRAL